MLSADEIRENYSQVSERLGNACISAGRNAEDVRIIPVSKTHPVELILNAMEAGIGLFAENYAQELRDKFAEFESKGYSIPEWHFIGNLQRNKVKYVVPVASMIHSVDSFKIATEIQKQCERFDKSIDILLQVNTSGEESKSGCEPGEVFNLYEKISSLDRLNVHGLMTIAGLWGDTSRVQSEFRLLSELKDELNIKFEAGLNELSMGMSGDFEKAVMEGSTMIRVGTAIFGVRDYSN